MHYGLISCVKQKRFGIHKASDLYTSSLFKFGFAFLQGRCDRLFILSAKYGLLDPDTAIANYEETLKTKSIEERKFWAAKVISSVEREFIKNPPTEITVIAGLDYREFIEPYLRSLSIPIHIPCEGMGLGKQIQYLKQNA